MKTGEQIKIKFLEEEKEQKRIKENEEIVKRIAASNKKSNITAIQRDQFIIRQIEEGKTMSVKAIS